MNKITISMLVFLSLSQSVAYSQFGGGGMGGVRSGSLGERDMASAPSPKVQQALQAEMDFDFIENPLSDVVAYIADDSELQFIIDHLALDENGIDVEELITIKVKAPLHQALTLILKPLELAYVVDGDLLRITSEDAFEETFEMRMYDVSDLIAGEISNESLIETIQTLIPTTWMATDGNGGQASILNGSLIVNHNQMVHRQLDVFLSQLRALKVEQQAAAAQRVSVLTYRVHAPQDPAQFDLRSFPIGGMAASTPATIPKTESEQPIEKTDMSAFPEKLATLIPKLIAVDTWEAGDIVAVEGAVIVKQTDDVQQQIKNILQPFLASDEYPQSVSGGGSQGGGYGGGLGGGGFYQAPAAN